MMVNVFAGATESLSRSIEIQNGHMTLCTTHLPVRMFDKVNHVKLNHYVNLLT